MKLPGNSLGVSDALQWHDCPKKFHYNMQRHYGRKQEIAGVYPFALAYGNAMHDGAQYILDAGDDAYIDDALDYAWAKWSTQLKPEHHLELKQDLSVVHKRSIEAGNLLLLGTEMEMKTPIFTGREDGALDEEAAWYYYRFRVDALYVDKSDPNHYIVRDFKSTRAKKWQDDIDNDMQFTAYDYGIRKLHPNATKVTIWYDQVKHEEMFTSRTDGDRIIFEEWIRATMIAILDAPEKDVSETFRMNNFCSWCPMITHCGVKNECTDFALIALQRNTLQPSKENSTKMIEEYDQVKQSIKALEAYRKEIEAAIKISPGKYGDRMYYESYVDTPKWKVETIAGIIGTEKAMQMATRLSKTAVKPLLEGPLGQEILQSAQLAGYSKMVSRKARHDDDNDLDELPF